MDIDDYPLEVPNNLKEFVMKGNAGLAKREKDTKTREFKCHEAVVKSKLSCHLVKFEQAIKVTTSIYLYYI